MTAMIDTNALADAPAPLTRPLDRAEEAARRGLASPAAPVAPAAPAEMAVGAVVLLAGSVRRNELVEAARRSRLDLPLDDRQTVLIQWQRQAAQWLAGAGQLGRPLRVLVDPITPVLPKSAVDVAGMSVSVEIDPQECRGTGGIVRDIAADYDDEQWLLVVSGAQVLLEPLSDLVARLRRVDGDVRLIAHADGTPAGLMLIRCGCLRKLDRVGFIDLKEQALPRIARGHRVGVVLSERPTALPLVTSRDYLWALRQHHLRQSNPQVLHDPFAEDWGCGFRVVEEGARIDASAHLHDSVVLRGARIEAGATVVRSLICSGATVAKNATVIDEVVTRDGNTNEA